MDCQRQSGSAFALTAGFDEPVPLDGERSRQFLRTVPPSRQTACLFCPDCGTRLFHVPVAGMAPVRNVKPGTLDDPSWLVPAVRFWARSAQRWVRVPAGVPRFDTQPKPPYETFRGVRPAP